MKIFSQSVGCLFVLLTVSFALQKLCNFMRSHLPIFDLTAQAIGMIVYLSDFFCDLCKVSNEDDMVVYISDPKNTTRELLNLINGFSEVAGYKINSKKSMAFLYTKDKKAEKEIRETTPLSILTNNIKYHYSH